MENQFDVDKCLGCSAFKRVCSAYNIAANSIGQCPCTECLIKSMCHISRDDYKLCEPRIEWSKKTIDLVETNTDFDQSVRTEVLRLYSK